MFSSELSDPCVCFLKGPDNLKFDPPDVFISNTVTVTCGPPPGNLNLVNWSAEWRRDDVLIRGDSEHMFSTENGAAILTVTKFFSTDNGKK